MSIQSSFFIQLRDCYVGYSLNKTKQRTITNSFKKRIKLNISSKEIVPSSFVMDKTHRRQLGIVLLLYMLLS